MPTSHEWSICPHCGFHHGDVNESAAARSPDRWHAETCSGCGKLYEALVSYEITVETRKVKEPT